MLESQHLQSNEFLEIGKPTCQENDDLEFAKFVKLMDFW